MCRVSILVSLVLGAMVAGCLASGPPVSVTPGGSTGLLTEPRYEIAHATASFDARSGARVWLNLFQPEDVSGPAPTILYLTPYARFGDARDDCTDTDRSACIPLEYLVDYFVPRGYVVAFGDARGFHNSGGCPDMFGPETWADGYDTVEWIASQPWSNGRVGMYGGSADGTTQIGTATLRPPHLTTIVPFSAEVSQYDFAFYDGVPAFTAGPASGAFYMGSSAVPGTDPGSPSEYMTRLGCQGDNVAEQTDQSGDWKPYWAERDLRPFVGGIQASVLYVHGLRDSTVLLHHQVDFWKNLTSEKRLILGRWDHEIPAREDWMSILHRWYDHFLLGTDTGLLTELPPVLVEDDTETWNGFDDYPPPNATRVIFHLGDGSLASQTGAEGVREIQDYPRGSVEGPVGAVLETPGSAANLPGSLIFETEPMTADFRIHGFPLVRLVAETDATSTHWVARLYEIADTDAGTEPADPANALARGFLDTRHRNGVDRPADLTPGETYDVTVHLLPVDAVIERGNRLMLVLTHNDNWVQQDTTYARSRVYVGAGGTTFELTSAP